MKPQKVAYDGIVEHGLEEVEGRDRGGEGGEDEEARDGHTPEKPPARVPPPSKHQLALMIWLCVFPTLTVINVAFGDWLRTMSPVPRTFVLATIAVPIVIYAQRSRYSPQVRAFEWPPWECWARNA